MSINKALKMKINDPRFGNGVHFTVTGTTYHVTLNNIDRASASKQLWATTVWFKNKLSGEDVTMDWVMGVYAMLDQVQKYAPILLEDYMGLCHAELDFNDVSGTDWEAAISVRALTRREVQTLEEDSEIELEPRLDDSLEFSVMYYGELLPEEVCEFDEPLTNIRPDLVKIFKLNKKRK